MLMAVEFSQEIFDTICERISDGESVNSICSGDDMPSRTSFYDWIGRAKELADKYARATEVRADRVFDELLQIADTPLIGEKVKIDKDGKKEVQRGDMIEHRRLQVDARKWALARMSPRKYGDRLGLDHSGGVSVLLEGDAEDL